MDACSEWLGGGLRAERYLCVVPPPPRLLVLLGPCWGSPRLDPTRVTNKHTVAPLSFANGYFREMREFWWCFGFVVVVLGWLGFGCVFFFFFSFVFEPPTAPTAPGVGKKLFPQHSPNCWPWGKGEGKVGIGRGRGTGTGTSYRENLEWMGAPVTTRAKSRNGRADKSR